MRVTGRHPRRQLRVCSESDFGVDKSHNGRCGDRARLAQPATGGSRSAREPCYSKQLPRISQRQRALNLCPDVSYGSISPLRGHNTQILRCTTAILTAVCSGTDYRDCGLTKRRNGLGRDVGSVAKRPVMQRAGKFAFPPSSKSTTQRVRECPDGGSGASGIQRGTCRQSDYMSGGVS